jgi:hypothetical protein
MGDTEMESKNILLTFFICLILLSFSVVSTCKSSSLPATSEGSQGAQLDREGIDSSRTWSTKLSVSRDDCPTYETDPDRSLWTLIGTQLIGEGVNFIYKQIEKEISKTGASFSSKNTFTAPTDGNDEATFFEDIKCLRMQRENVFDLFVQLERYQEKYIRMYPTKFVYKETAAKYGKNSPKDLNIIYKFVFPAKTPGGTSSEFILGPISFEKIQPSEEQIGSDKFQNITTDWIHKPENTSEQPYTIYCDVVESAHGKGKELANVMSRLLKDEEIKQKIIDAIIKKLFEE